jgi:hypothetical protein
VKDSRRDDEGLAGLATETGGDELRIIAKDPCLIVGGFEAQDLPAELNRILGYCVQYLSNEVGSAFAAGPMCSVQVSLYLVLLSPHPF